MRLFYKACYPSQGKFREPGVYADANHMLIEAVELDALAHFKVENKWKDCLMSNNTSQPITPVEASRSLMARRAVLCVPLVGSQPSRHRSVRP